MTDYISENPQFMVNGFIHSGIVGALEETRLLTPKTSQETDSEQDSDKSEEGSEDEEETRGQS